jgi:general secretion pathway protein K
MTRVRRSRGFALITVLWFLVLLAAVGAYMVTNARSQTALAHNVLAGVRAEALADAAVARAAFNLSQPDQDQDKKWRLDGTPYALALPGGQATVALRDERAKINPNLASDILLTDLFEAVGVDKAQSGHLGASIADWVQKGDQARPLGAKLPDYQQAGRKYGPPGAAVETLDELDLVLGMTPALLDAVRPYLTIYTEEPVPTHLALAAAPVAKAVDAAAHDPATNSSGVTQGDLSNQQQAQPSQPQAEPPPGPPGAPGSPAGATAAQDAAIVTVDVVARSFDGGVFARRAVIKLDFDDPKGYKILDWRRVSLPN